MDRFPDVLEAAQAGDLRALERLYRELAPPVLGYLRGQGVRDPDDLASEVFVGMVRNLQRFRGDEAAFRSWVFTITHRRLLDHRRHLARRREEAVDPSQLAGPLSDGVVGDAEGEAMSRLGTEWALRAIRRLSPDQRAVLLLRVLADLSVEEVARILGKTRGAVKALQRRALAALVRTMEREGVS